MLQRQEPEAQQQTLRSINPPCQLVSAVDLDPKGILGFIHHSIGAFNGCILTLLFCILNNKLNLYYHALSTHKCSTDTDLNFSTAGSLAFSDPRLTFQIFLPNLLSLLHLFLLI